MGKKPTYEELEQKITELEKEHSECVRIEEALKKSEQEKSAILDSMKELVVYQDTDHTVLWANRAASESVGVVPEKLVGRSCYEIWAKRGTPCEGCPVIKARETLHPQEAEITTPDGRVWLVHGYPIRDASLIVVGAVETTLEITANKRLDEAMKQSEERYRTIIDGIEEAYFEVDLNGTLTFFNDALLKITGYTHDELMGMNNREYTTQETAQKMYKTFNKVYQTGKPLRVMDYEIMVKDGRKIVVEMSTSLLRDPSGTPIGFRGIFRDITSRKQAEEALRENEERYRTILESIDEGYYEVDISGNLTFVNESMSNILGYSKKELIGMSNRNFMDKANAKNMFHTFNRVYTTGKPDKELDWEIIRKDNTKRNVETSTSLMKDKDGEKIGFRGILRDITERKRSDEALKTRQTYLESVLYSAPDAIVTLDASHHVLEWNIGAEQIFGYSSHEAVGRNLDDLVTGSDVIKESKELTSQVLSGGKVLPRETVRYRKDGTPVTVIVAGSPIIISGKLQGVVAVYTDITSRKKAEEEKITLEAQLIQAQKMEAIGTLAGGIAHNFNNLLMSIQGNASLMLLDTDPTHPHYERLTTIEQSVRSGSKLTSQLLGYARGGSYEVTPISINRIIHETSSTFSMTRKDITLHHDLADTLAGVKADAGQIEQVILNIYVNAAEAMPTGGDLFITTENITHTQITKKSYTIKPGTYILLTIKDTGIGMDKATQEKVFDPFFTTKGLAKGTGLGLASVYGIVKAHGGYIDVASQKGVGTTFFIYLPASKEIIREESRPTKSIETGNETILLVDDEEIILDVGEALLTSLGYRVLTAQGGDAAISILRSSLPSSPPDLVILDMIMPGMGGGETYDRMKEIHPPLKVLLSSGYSIDGQAQEILKRGCNGFLQKPFTLGEVSKAIREVVGER